jgi:hypothetical protein
LAPLRVDRYDGYLWQPIPSPLDDDSRAVVEAYLGGDASLRAAILEGMDGDSGSALRCFGEREAVEAVRVGSVDLIRLGLVAVALGTPGEDFREVQLSLSKLDHSARLLGTDLADVFEGVAALLSEQAREELGTFVRRADRDASLLGRMGFAAKGSGQSFIYEDA